MNARLDDVEFTMRRRAEEWEGAARCNLPRVNRYDQESYRRYLDKSQSWRGIIPCT
jgi:hypothetical protein